MFLSTFFVYVLCKVWAIESNFIRPSCRAKQYLHLGWEMFPIISYQLRSISMRKMCSGNSDMYDLFHYDMSHSENEKSESVVSCGCCICITCVSVFAVSFHAIQHCQYWKYPTNQMYLSVQLSKGTCGFWFYVLPPIVDRVIWFSDPLNLHT